MLSKLVGKTRELFNLTYKVDGLKPKVDLSRKNPKVLTGRLLANFNNQFIKEVRNLSDVEFQVYSQWGDDGIIQWLIHQVEMPNKTFVEFGVQDFSEANMRFLLVNNNWEGFIMDGSEDNVNYVRNDSINYHHHISSKSVFITRENINDLLLKRPFKKDIDILSIDIDGNDYWIWKEITLTTPILVICEYNAVFGLNPWTIPYQSDFIRDYASDKMIYYGSSLQSLCDLAETKGYFFIGCNSAGNNAYFLRKDKIGNIKPLSAEEGFEEAKFRETNVLNGEIAPDEIRFKAINDMKIFNTRTNKEEKIKF